MKLLGHTVSVDSQLRSGNRKIELGYRHKISNIEQDIWEVWISTDIETVIKEGLVSEVQGETKGLPEVVIHIDDQTVDWVVLTSEFIKDVTPV